VQALINNTRRLIKQSIPAEAVCKPDLNKIIPLLLEHESTSAQASVKNVMLDAMTTNRTNQPTRES